MSERDGASFVAFLANIALLRRCPCRSLETVKKRILAGTEELRVSASSNRELSQEVRVSEERSDEMRRRAHWMFPYATDTSVRNVAAVNTACLFRLRQLAAERKKAAALEEGIAKMHKTNKVMQGDLSVQRCELEKAKLVVESLEGKVRHLEESLKSTTALVRTLRESQELEGAKSGFSSQATLALQARNSSLETQLSKVRSETTSREGGLILHRCC